MQVPDMVVMVTVLDIRCVVSVQRVCVGLTHGDGWDDGVGGGRLGLHWDGRGRSVHHHMTWKTGQREPIRGWGSEYSSDLELLSEKVHKHRKHEN